MLWQKAERCHEYPAGSRLVSNSCALLAAIVLSIYGALLAACAAEPTTPAPTVGAALTTDQSSTSAEDQHGELHLVVMPPDALIGGLAEARR